MAGRDSFADRVTELEDWRRLVVDRELDELRRDVAAMIESQKIAAGVADELRKRGITAEGVSERTATKTAAKLEANGLPARELALTFWQKLGGLVAGAILLADAVRGLFS